jgi:hypothetical protein
MHRMWLDGTDSQASRPPHPPRRDRFGAAIRSAKDVGRSVRFGPVQWPRQTRAVSLDDLTRRLNGRLRTERGPGRSGCGKDRYQSGRRRTSGFRSPAHARQRERGESEPQPVRGGGFHRRRPEATRRVIGQGVLSQVTFSPHCEGTEEAGRQPYREAAKRHR